MVRYLPLIVKNCWRNRRRTILTIASIGISMCLLGVMITMYHAFYLSDPTPDQALRLLTENRVSLTTVIPRAYQSRIERVPGVRMVMVYDWYGGTYKDNRDPKNQFARFAVEPEKLFKVFGEYRIPDDQKKAFEGERSSCVIGRDLVNTFGFKLGDHIHFTGDIYPGSLDLTVRGIFDSPAASNLLFFDKEYLEQSLPERRRGQVDMYEVLVDNPANSARIAKSIDEQFRNSTAQTRTQSEQAFFVGFLSLLGNVKMFLMAIAGAVMFTVLLVSANTMAMSVRERVREVGVLRTLGFTPAAVLGVILGEACLISLAGGLVGFAISAFLMQGVKNSPFGGFLPPLPFIEPGVMLTCLAIAATIGVLSSFVPAWGASRTPIVQALRSTD